MKVIVDVSDKYMNTHGFTEQELVDLLFMVQDGSTQ